MSGAAFLRIKKLKGGGIITVAARHNKREIQAEMGATGTIDPTRSHLNYALAGPADAGDVGQLAKDLMTAAGLVKLRKDAVMALEIVFSLPPGHALDDRAYFTDCAAWAGRYFGGVVLSADVHQDEAASHCHVLLLPLIDGRMAGSDMLGGKQVLMALQKQFHFDVAGRYGLSKAPAKLTGASKQAASTAVLQRLRERGDKALQSKVWATLRDAIERDPVPFLLALGIELQAPANKLKTLTQIMTSKGKGKSKEANPIGFTQREKRQTLCSVGFIANSQPSKASTPLPPAQREELVIAVSVAHDQPLTSTPNADGEVAPLALSEVIDLPDADDGILPDTQAFEQHNEIEAVDAPFVETTRREKEIDLDPARYDLTTGGYFPAAMQPSRFKRKVADGWVNAALATRSKTVGATAID